MKLTVLGATGGVGREVVGQALSRGDHVTAVVRDPGRLGVTHPHLDVITADVTEADALASAVVGRDAVVSALGLRPGQHQPICAPAARATIEAMRGAGVRRLVVVSASGLAIDAGDGILTRTVFKPIIQRLLREGFADLSTMEDLVRGSGLEWTIVRPPRLTDKPRTGRYRTAIDVNVRRGLFVSRADVADAILSAIGTEATIGHTLGLGN